MMTVLDGRLSTFASARAPGVEARVGKVVAFVARACVRPRRRQGGPKDLSIAFANDNLAPKAGSLRVVTDAGDPV